MILENSKVVLLENIDLDSNYNYTIDFNNVEAQAAYFDNKKSLLLDNAEYSYIKSDDTLNVDLPLEELYNINYFYYINTDDLKRYYCFVTDKQYVAEDTTKLIFKIDTYQTYMFDFEISESFIEREHQDRFTIDKKVIYNTNDENLDYGNKYKLDNIKNIKNNNLRFTYTNGIYREYQQGYIVAVCNKAIDGDTIGSKAFNSNFMPSPFVLYAFPMCTMFEYNKDNTLSSTQLIPSLNSNVGIKQGDTIKYISSFGKIMNCEEFKNGEILAALYYTSNISSNVNLYLDSTIPIFETNLMVNLNLTNGEKFSTPAIKLTGYGKKELLPINKDINYNLSLLNINNKKNIELEPKLNTNPYLYFIFDNDSQQLILYNEYLPTNVTIINEFIESVQPKNIYHIKDYLGNNRNEELTDNTIKDLPIVTQEYLKYMAQNKAAATTGIAVDIGASVANVGLGLATGGIGLAVAGSTAIGIMQTIAQENIKRKDLKQLGNKTQAIGNNGYFSLQSLRCNLKLLKYSITDEYKNKIFNYLYHYGYKCNDFKKPDIKSRYYFNYIKTIGCNIKANVNNDVKVELANIFNNGITIFHYRDTNTFKGVNNYDYENVEMKLLGGNK